MNHLTNFETVRQASLTILVDNKADLIVKSSDRVSYFTKEPLLAEHGFSVLIQLEESPDRILWDAGVSKVALLENIRRMELDIASIRAIALSHGHSDHYGGMTELLAEMDLSPRSKEWRGPVQDGEVRAWLAESRIPLVVHPAAFRERWWQKEDGGLIGPFVPPPEAEWSTLGAELRLEEQPCQLANGCWTTGYIPRESFETVGRPKGAIHRTSAGFAADDIEDDQAVVINVEGKGLVVLSGCAHSGIINTVEYAREFTGCSTVYAIIGGFHLAQANDDEIEQTIAHLQALEPHVVVPSHCTGLKAISRIGQAMPEAFVEGVVGATFVL